MHVPWIQLKFHSSIFRLFRFAKNWKFRENVGTARRAGPRDVVAGGGGGALKADVLNRAAKAAMGESMRGG